MSGNFAAVRIDLRSMSCSAWIDALSARADGEDPGIDERLLEAHLEACAACRTFAATVDGTRRRTLLAPAAAMPDLSARVARLNAVADRASRWGVVRALLAVVALEVIVMAVPGLVLGEGESRAHDARHLGAFSVAYGVALLVVVIRPARARTVLPVAAFLAIALTATAAVDLASGSAPWDGEVSHLSEVLSVALVWMIAVPRTRRAPAPDRTSRGVLRVVDAPERRGERSA